MGFWGVQPGFLVMGTWFGSRLGRVGPSAVLITERLLALVVG